MRKFICLLFICLFALWSTSCTNPPVTVDTQESHKNYVIKKMEDGSVQYEIYDLTGQIVLSETTQRPVNIKSLDSKMLDIEIGMGTGLALHKYYNIEQSLFSEEFLYVVANYKELVAYIDVENGLDDRKLVVRNVFDETVYYKEFYLDFAKTDTPILNAIFLENGLSLQVTYLSQEAQVEIVVELPI